MPTLLIYGLVALAVLGALGGISYKIHHAGYEDGIAEVTPKLTACEGREKGLQGQIEVQNRAVDALKAEGEAKVARATKGLADATRAAQGARSEAERLRSLAGGGKPSACPAGDAVGEIRRGLGK